MKSFPEFEKKGVIKTLWRRKKVQRYWVKTMYKTYNAKKKGSWDYQWLFSIWEKDGLCIAPNKNLVSHIGFGKDATHTISDYPFLFISRHHLRKIIDPKQIILNIEADEFYCNEYWVNDLRKIFYRLRLNRLRSKIINLFHKNNKRVAAKKFNR